MSGAGRENCKKRKNRESRQSPTPYDLWLSNSVCAFWWSYTLCCLDCGGKPRSRQRGQQCDVSCEMRNVPRPGRSEEHTSELQSHSDLVCRLLLEKKKKQSKQDKQ